jgi:hypothetical protein
VDVDVTVTDAGQLQLSVDGVTYPPLPVEAVRALAERVPEAQAASARQQVTAAVRALTDVLITSGAGMAASVEVGPAGVTAEVDPASFERAQRLLGVTPDSAGELRSGRITIRRQPTPTVVTGSGALVAPPFALTPTPEPT